MCQTFRAPVSTLKNCIHRHHKLMSVCAFPLNRGVDICRCFLFQTLTATEGSRFLQILNIQIFKPFFFIVAVIQIGYLFTWMEEFITFIPALDCVSFFPGTEECLNPVFLIVFQSPVCSALFVTDFNIMFLHLFGSWEHCSDHRICCHSAHLVYHTAPVLICRDTAEMQNVIQIFSV